MDNFNSLVCAGDARMLRCAELLSYHGNCWLWKTAKGSCKNAIVIEDLKRITKDDMIILPIPSFDKNGILNFTENVKAEEFFSMLPHGMRIFGGKFSKFIYKSAAEYGHILYDYGEREDFNLFNAIPTAEAAITIAANHSERTIHGSKFIVAGYGRIGKALSRRLISLGGIVTVAARREASLAMAECDGCIPLPLAELHESKIGYDTFFNTIPCTIFDLNDAKKWDSSHFIELASLPGGFTKEAIDHLGERYISALSLPGKFFPITAGEIIYKTIINQINSYKGNNI